MKITLLVLFVTVAYASADFSYLGKLKDQLIENVSGVMNKLPFDSLLEQVPDEVQDKVEEALSKAGNTVNIDFKYKYKFDKHDVDLWRRCGCDVKKPASDESKSVENIKEKLTDAQRAARRKAKRQAKRAAKKAKPQTKPAKVPENLIEKTKPAPRPKNVKLTKQQRAARRKAKRRA